MPLEEYKYLMVDSDDFWGYDDSSYDDESNWYGTVFVVPKAIVEEKPSLISELNLMPCAMFFSVNDEDDQNFTPTSIKVDEEKMIAVIKGVQKRLGEDVRDEVRPFIFKFGSLAPPYKNMNEYGKVTLGRFNVDNMIFSNEDNDFEAPKERLEELTQYRERLNPTDEKVVAEAEFFNAETLERINPTIVEGAEDIMGAESQGCGCGAGGCGCKSAETFKSSNINSNIMNAQDGLATDSQSPLANPAIFGEGVNENVIGQEYVGQVIGQDAEDGLATDSQSPLANPAIFGEGVNENVIGQEYVGQVIGQDAESAFFPNGDGRNFGNVTADGQYEPLGANAEGVENDILSAEFNVESNEVKINTLKGEQFTVNAGNGMVKNADGTFDAEESEALSAEDMTIVMNAAGYVPSGEWGSMHPNEANHGFMWEFRNAEEVASGEWGSMDPAEANQDYMWAFRNAEHEGYDDRDDESIGERNRGKHKQNLKDRRDESKAMTAKGDPHHPYADVGTMEAQGYDDRDDESIGERNRGKHKQNLKDRRDESKAMTAKGDPHHPYSEVSTMSAEYVTDEGVLLGAAQNTRELLEDRDTDIVDMVQDAPFIRDFRLSGWAASALVLGTAWVFGRRSKAKSTEIKEAEIEVSRTIGEVGGANDFGQDPVMIHADPEHRLFRLHDKLPSSADHNPLHYYPQ